MFWPNEVQSQKRCHCLEIIMRFEKHSQRESSSVVWRIMYLLLFLLGDALNKSEKYLNRVAWGKRRKWIWKVLLFRGNPIYADERCEWCCYSHTKRNLAMHGHLRADNDFGIWMTVVCHGQLRAPSLLQRNPRQEQAGPKETSSTSHWLAGLLGLKALLQLLRGLLCFLRFFSWFF